MAAVSPVRVIFNIGWRQNWHTITRSGWAIAGAVVGALYGLSVVIGLAAAVIFMRFTMSAERLAAVSILGALIIGAAWFVVNIISGISSPLAPEHFCLLPVKRRDLARGTLVAGILSITGIIFVILAALLVIPYTTNLLATVSAVVMLPVAVLVWFLFGRVAADGLAGQFAGRRTREIMFMLVVILLSFSGLLAQALINGLAEIAVSDDAAQSLASLTNTLQWIPFATPFAVPAAVAQGAWITAGAQVLISLATAAVLWLLWSKMLSDRLTAPVLQRGAKAVKASSFLDRVFPATPLGAFMVRQLRYTRRDNRHLINLVMTLLIIPLLALVFGTQALSFGGDMETGAYGGVSPGMFLPFVVLILPLVLVSVAQLDLAYDGSSLAWNMYASVSGKLDRWGRILTKLIVYLPLLLIEAVAITLLVGVPSQLPGIIGITIVSVAVGLATGFTMGVWFPGVVPEPGANPFGKGSAGNIHSLFGTLALFVTFPVLAALPVGLAIASMWTPWFGWLALASGIVLGALSLFLCVWISAPVYEKRQSQILAYVAK